MRFEDGGVRGGGGGGGDRFTGLLGRASDVTIIFHFLILQYVRMNVINANDVFSRRR